MRPMEMHWPPYGGVVAGSEGPHSACAGVAPPRGGAVIRPTDWGSPTTTTARALTGATKLLCLLGAALLASACATKIKPTVAWNPPPAEALANFSKYELRPVTLAPSVERSGSVEKAMVKIRENVDHKLVPLLSRWSLAFDEGGRTLVIEPRIEELKFVGGGKRFLVGWMAGSSAVRFTLMLRAEPGGEVIATPEFFQRAAAYGGMWSVGGTDNAMLVRVSTVLQEYLERNYDEPTGGPTGLESAVAP